VVVIGLLAYSLATLVEVKAVEHPNLARRKGGWNCDSHVATADALGLDGYRLIRRIPAPRGQFVEVWKNVVPRYARKPDRDDFIRVQHSAREDCVIVEKSHG
jgi:hypothetical protein